MELDEYRILVIDSVPCPACGAGITWPCLKLPEIEFAVDYVHDDRSLAHFNTIPKAS